MNEELKALLDEFRARLDALEAKATAESESSPVAEYIDELHAKLEAYYLNVDSEVEHDLLGNEDIDCCSNKYQYYLTEQYAERAYLMKLINDMMLAFKWCHDVASQWVTERKNYTVTYDCQLGKFTVIEHQYQRMFNTVYFCNLEVAQQCANWLNTELAEICSETWG